MGDDDDDDDEECMHAGRGKCHGCLKWCSVCGDVTHVCDTRLRGERCAEHPVPAPWGVLRAARTAAESKLLEARRLDREGRQALQEVVASENARRAYERQLAEEERAVMSAAMGGNKE